MNVKDMSDDELIWTRDLRWKEYQAAALEVNRRALKAGVLTIEDMFVWQCLNRGRDLSE